MKMRIREGKPQWPKSPLEVIRRGGGRGRGRAGPRFLLAIFFFAFFFPRVFAGEYHAVSNNTLRCSDCHTMHNFQSGLPVAAGGPFNRLLKAASINLLCMSCHDGTNADAPDIVAAGTAVAPNNILSTAYGSIYKNAAGFFQSDWNSTVTTVGHDLYSAGILTAPGGTWTTPASGMTCKNCHEVHGNPRYRNLERNPGGVAVSVTLGTNVTETTAVSLPPTANPAVAYNHDNIGYVSNIGAWCGGCHTSFNGTANTGYSSTLPHHTRHAIDAQMDGANPAYSSIHVDSANWTAGVGQGFGGGLEDGVAGIPRTRFEGAAVATSRVVATSNKVFCFSCHKAHGSTYDSNMMWAWKATTANQKLEMYSGCQQCHNQ